MSATVTLPAAPGPYLGTGLLPGDFYSYEELLSDKEREQVERMRGASR
jgi:glutaryl-CoA dehydrogenase